MPVAVREIVGWGVDVNSYRPQSDALTQTVERATLYATALAPFVQEDPRIDVPEEVSSALASQSLRADLIEEMDGLAWTTGVVDLTRLVCFQRRIIDDGHHAASSLPAADDWASLIGIAFGPVAPIAYRITGRNASGITIESANPNLQFRAGQSIEAPVVLHGGSPFLEVAEYRGRWFLRDGYHRAYRLLRSGITLMPSVIVHAGTLAELGPVQPWFFDEDALFGVRPPLVSDFLNDELTMTYTRPLLRKVLRVTMEETVEPATTEDVKEITA
jgi:hypothetical protein